jgi:hypothetical protein
LAKTIRGEFMEADKKSGQKVSLLRGSENIGEVINLASAKIMLEDELAMGGSVLVFSQDNTHTNTVYLPRGKGDSNPVRQILRSQFG